jgi:hypothetical protein
MNPLQSDIYQVIHILELAKQFQGRVFEADLKKIAKHLLTDCVKEILPEVKDEEPTVKNTESVSTGEESLEGMPDLEETTVAATNPPVPLTHSPIQLNEPTWQVLEDDEKTETTRTHGGKKKDFTRWCKSLNLEEGHPFFYIKGGQSVQVFNLIYKRDGTAHIQGTCSDGTILMGTPRSVLKAYIRKTTNKERNFDTWDILSMQSPNGLTKWPISHFHWINYEWNTKTKKFDSLLSN